MRDGKDCAQAFDGALDGVLADAKIEIPPVGDDDALEDWETQRLVERVTGPAFPAVLNGVMQDVAEDAGWNAAHDETFVEEYYDPTFHEWCEADRYTEPCYRTQSERALPGTAGSVERAKSEIVVIDDIYAKLKMLAPAADLAPLEEKRRTIRVELRQVQQAHLRAMMVRAIRPIRAQKGRASRARRVATGRVRSRSAGGGSSGRSTDDPVPPPLQAAARDLAVRPREVVDALERCLPAEGAVWPEVIVGVERRGE
jgi:hypothetical protein